MANPLARQMLNNLARKAGQSKADNSHKTAIVSQGVSNLNQQEEKRLVDLIHLRQRLFPENESRNKDGVKQQHQPKRDMISLSELAKKK